MFLATPTLSYLGPVDTKRLFCVATIRRDARTGAVTILASGAVPMKDDSFVRCDVSIHLDLPETISTLAPVARPIP